MNTFILYFDFFAILYHFNALYLLSMIAEIAISVVFFIYAHESIIIGLGRAPANNVVIIEEESIVEE